MIASVLLLFFLFVWFCDLCLMQIFHIIKVYYETWNWCICSIVIATIGKICIRDYLTFLITCYFILNVFHFFSQCQSRILQAVDNYPILCLDIVWCYLELHSVNSLPDAGKNIIWKHCVCIIRKSFLSWYFIGLIYEFLYSVGCDFFNTVVIAFVM